MTSAYAKDGTWSERSAQAANLSRSSMKRPERSSLTDHVVDEDRAVARPHTGRGQPQRRENSAFAIHFDHGLPDCDLIRGAIRPAPMKLKKQSRRGAGADTLEVTHASHDLPTRASCPVCFGCRCRCRLLRCSTAQDRATTDATVTPAPVGDAHLDGPITVLAAASLTEAFQSLGTAFETEYP